MYALGKLARGGATRGGYHSGLPFVAIAGVQYATGNHHPTQKVLIGDLQIHDVLDQTPNTCQLTTMGFVPTAGQSIVITLGSANSLTRAFAGIVLSEDQAYFADNPAHVYHRLNGIDYTWQLTQHYAIKRYTNTTTGAIARDLIASFTDGYTANAIAPDADGIAIAEITFTNTLIPDALTQLCKQAGAYWNVDYFKDLHLFVGTEPNRQNPIPLTLSHRTMAAIDVQRDLSQLVTRAIVEGGGGMAATDIPAGETQIPLDTIGWYQAAGGLVTSGPQRLSYTGLATGGGGALVGPGAAPTSPPVPVGLADTAGNLLPATQYGYSYTFVTAQGESIASPMGTVSTQGKPADPTIAPIVQRAGINWSQIVPVGATIQVCYCWATGSSPTAAGVLHSNNGPVAAPITAIAPVGGMSPPAGAIDPFYFNLYNSSETRYTWIWILVQSSHLGPNFYHLVSVQNTPAAGGQPYHFDTTSMSALTTYYAWPGGNTFTGAQQVRVDGVAIGQAVVTSRKLYRSRPGAYTSKLLATVADNTTTSYTDNVADAALGAAPPTVDNSGLQMPAGAVPAGSTTLPIAGSGSFLAGGGWAVIGNGQQTIRYHGFSGGTLTGIPASGPGSITASVSYNSTVTQAPALVGIPASGTGAILYTIKSGDDVNLLVILDDPASQNWLKSLIGGTGVRESYVQDRRISYTEAIARGQALLNLRDTLAVTVRYRCRDRATAAGKTIHVDLPAPWTITGDYKLQDVTIGSWTGRPNQGPFYTVSASSERFALEDLLRVARARQGA